MNYTTLTVGSKELKLRLNARQTVELEKKLKTNPLQPLMEIEKGNLPTTEQVITILHCSLQALEHGYTLDKTYDLYDEYLDNGGNYTDLFQVIIEIYQCSGIIPKVSKTEEEAAKNA